MTFNLLLLIFLKQIKIYNDKITFKINNKCGPMKKNQLNKCCHFPKLAAFKFTIELSHKSG